MKTPRTRAQADRMYAHVEETDGRGAADELAARWQRDQEDAEERHLERHSTTVVTITNGARVPLAFGARFRVRTVRAELADALLESREPNGDLRFLVDPGPDGSDGGVRRIRPASIAAIFGSGVEYELVASAGESLAEPEPFPIRRPDETSADLIERAERTLGTRYAEWTGTDAGQAALSAAALEDRMARSGLSLVGEPKLSRKGRAKLVDAGVDPAIVAGAETVSEVASATRTPVAARKPAARTSTPLVVVEPVASSKAPRKAIPYADKNHIWKCGSCHTRTRAESCSRGHDLVAAPAGARKADRVTA